MDKQHFLQYVLFDPKQESTSGTYYWNIYQKYHKNIFFLKANWPCFIFGSWWLLYRRMYFWFAIFFIGIESIIQYAFMAQGFDRGLSNAYSSCVSNIIVALIGTPLYFRFINKKKKHIGVHLRLMLPGAILLKYVFGALLFQLIGLYINNYTMIMSIYYFLTIVVAYVIMLYIFYFLDWLKQDI